MKTPNHKIKPATKLCPVCLIQPATIHVLFGVLPCALCQQKREENSLPDNPVEMTSKEIKEGRKAYAKSALQPWRNHEASSEFIEAYPETAKEIFSEKEIKKAKPVWNDVTSLRNWRNTK